MADDTDKDTKLTAAERKTIAKMIEESSLLATANKIGVAPQTLRALAGGLTGHRGTILLVRRGLGE